MAVSALDTHELVKDLKSAGFTDEQAEAVTRAVKRSHEFDFADLATKAELADTKTELIKWVVGIAFAQVAMILAIPKLFPSGHP